MNATLLLPFADGRSLQPLSLPVPANLLLEDDEDDQEAAITILLLKFNGVSQRFNYRYDYRRLDHFGSVMMAL